MPPEPELMLRRCDAALLIGDPALFLDHERLGAEKIDLGEQWTSMTGLPFVWAFWAVPAALLDQQDVAVPGVLQVVHPPERLVEVDQRLGVQLDLGEAPAGERQE